MEVWKDIKDYEGRYQVSNYGRVKSLIFRGKKREKILKLRNDTNGYPIATLYKDGEKATISVHRLVANAFIPNPDNNPTVDHIDTNICNNHVENLRWCSQHENNINPISYEKRVNAIINKHAVKIIAIINGERKEYKSQREAEIDLNLGSGYICTYFKKRLHNKHGYQFFKYT